MPKKQRRSGAATPFVSMGLERHNAGDIDGAAGLYQQALDADPRDPDALHLSGVIRHMRGDNTTARKLIERAIKVNGRQAGYHANLGRVFMAMRRIDGAIGAFRKAVRIDDHFHPARLALANALLESGREEEALEVFEEACRREPRDPVAATGLGIALRQAGETEPALEAYDRAIALDPRQIKALADKGNMLSELGQHHEALACYDTALAVDGSVAELHANRGAVLSELGDAAGAARSHDAALRIAPAFTRSLWGRELALPIVYESAEQIDEARARWERGLDVLEDETRLDSPEDVARAILAVRSMPPFLLHYQGRNDVDLMRRWGVLVRRIVSAAHPELCEPLDGRRRGEKLRVGFVSPFFRRHSIFKTHGGWITELNRDRFEPCVIHTGAQADEATGRLRHAAAEFLHLPDPDGEAAARIRALDLDVLIHMDIGMNPSSQYLAAMRLAPVQANGLGHPVTCGLDTVDFALTSASMEPDEGEGHYTEELVRLANLASCYRRDAVPPFEMQISVGAREPVYFCAQSLFKLLPGDEEVFARIARESGPCRLRFIQHASPYVMAVFTRRIELAFSAVGLDAADYCELLQPMSQAEFFEACNEADVLLDSFSWSGNNSTLEGLAADTPVVTCPGRFMRGRHAAAILHLAGLAELVAEDRDAYVDLAVRLGRDAPFRGAIVERLREGCGRVFEDTAPVRDLERFLLSACASAT